MWAVQDILGIGRKPGDKKEKGWYAEKTIFQTSKIKNTAQNQNKSDLHREGKQEQKGFSCMITKETKESFTKNNSRADT